MTIEEREMILNLSYQELIEKFKNEPQILIKNIGLETKEIEGKEIIDNKSFF